MPFTAYGQETDCAYSITMVPGTHTDRIDHDTSRDHITSGDMNHQTTSRLVIWWWCDVVWWCYVSVDV